MLGRVRAGRPPLALGRHRSQSHGAVVVYSRPTERLSKRPEEAFGRARQGVRAVFALADINTTQLLRALSLAGPTSVQELAARLTLPPATVRGILLRTTALGVVRSHAGSPGRYQLDAEALRAVVSGNRDALLGASV